MILEVLIRTNIRVLQDGLEHHAKVRLAGNREMVLEWDTKVRDLNEKSRCNILN